MKHVIVLGDGMADWTDATPEGKTLLQKAYTPNMDYIARMGRCGRLQTVPEGFHPGSEVANSSILGYDQHLVYEGRGPLEAAAIGVELGPDDLALRCNLVCLEGDRLKNHSCGRLETEEADVLIRYLDSQLGSGCHEGPGAGRVRFYTGVQYRHLLVVRGGDKRLLCTPPHDIPGKVYADYGIRAACSEAEETARLLNWLTQESQRLLPAHPINLKRQAEGRDPANSIWPWGGGYRPKMVPLQQTFDTIHRGTVITAVDLIRGIGHYAGLRPVEVPGATGLYDTNYEGKAQAALEALRTDDFVYVHVEASDEAGHDGNVALKLQTIEHLDRRLLGPLLEGIAGIDEPVAVAVLPDHPTPCSLRTHTAEPVPFAIWIPGVAPDGVQVFDEFSVHEGAFGLLHGDEFIRAFMGQFDCAEASTR